MSVYCIDFETFYDKEYSIKEMSTYRYMHDPRFDAYLVAVYSDDYQYLGPPKAFDWSLLEGSTVLMHNAVFDHSVVLRLQELGIVHKSLRYKMFDTADMAAFLRAPRHLKGAAKQLLGVDMDKSVRDYMKGKTFETLSPDDVEKVRQYGLTDARLTYELWKKYHDQWPAEEQELSRLNREAQLYGVQLDMGKVEAGVQSLQNQVFEAERAIPWIDEFPPLSPKAVRIQGRKDGIPVPASLAKTDEAAIAWENEYGERYPWIAAIKNYRSINTVYKKMLNLRDGATENGVFQYAKKYYGAVTGRFSGGSDSGGKVNVENLSREDMFGVDMRGMFVARPGHSFIISDYAQVEPRLLLWRVGDTTMLDAIRNGLGIYDAHARMYMGYTKAAKLKEGDNRLYRLSKARVIGLGYGCGPDKFVAVAKTMADVVITPEESAIQVADYRATNSRVVDYWTRHNTWLKVSANHKDAEHEVPLASGRSLRYFDPMYRKSVDKKGRERYSLAARDERGGPHFSLWGGTLTENEIQALARDVLRDAWIALERENAGRVLFTVHDEFLNEVRDEDVERMLPEIERIMVTSSPWAKGCPLAVESKVAKAYCK